jgi:hypothetical protein
MNLLPILDFGSRPTDNDSMTSKPCSKCGGTGKVNSPVDFGRCWQCQGLAKPLTEAQKLDDEAYAREMGLGLTLEERSALRKAARAAKAS